MQACFLCKDMSRKHRALTFTIQYRFNTQCSHLDFNRHSFNTKPSSVRYKHFTQHPLARLLLTTLLYISLVGIILALCTIVNIMLNDAQTIIHILKTYYMTPTTFMIALIGYFLFIGLQSTLPNFYPPIPHESNIIKVDPRTLAPKKKSNTRPASLSEGQGQRLFALHSQAQQSSS